VLIPWRSFAYYRPRGGLEVMVAGPKLEYFDDAQIAGVA